MRSPRDYILLAWLFGSFSAFGPAAIDIYDSGLARIGQDKVAMSLIGATLAAAAFPLYWSYKLAEKSRDRS